MYAPTATKQNITISVRVVRMRELEENGQAVEEPAHEACIDQSLCRRRLRSPVWCVSSDFAAGLGRRVQRRRESRENVVEGQGLESALRILEAHLAVSGFASAAKQEF